MTPDVLVLIQLAGIVLTAGAAGGVVRAQLNGTRESVREIKRDVSWLRNVRDEDSARLAAVSERVAAVETRCQLHHYTFDHPRDDGRT